MLKNQNIKFIKRWNNSLIKEVIAFANTQGGVIYIGCDDNGKLIGLDDAKGDLDKLTNKLHDSIEPDINFLISPRIEKQEGKEFIILEVLKGTNKPYYIKSKGMTSEGVFVRVGATCQGATSYSIRDMIVESSNVTFEKNISAIQDLTFIYTDKVFKDKGIAFSDREKKMLGLINENNLYTNLGLLLSDQCPYTIKMAIYSDNTKREFIDQKETREGSVLAQIEEAENYLKLINRVAGKIQGMERIDTYDYPPEGIRELILNTVGHRNYEIPGSTLIHVFTDSIEFLSLGGLVNGLSLEDIKLGSSSSRNPKLINVFHRLGLVEAYGSGIPRLYELYKSANNLPEILVGPNSFLVKLPKLTIKDDYKVIINYLKNKDSATREELESVLNAKKVKTSEILKEMKNRDIVIKCGNAKNITYKLK